MRLKALLAILALACVTACASDPTSPSTSKTPTVLRADGTAGGGPNTAGSGG